MNNEKKKNEPTNAETNESHEILEQTTNNKFKDRVKCRLEVHVMRCLENHTTTTYITKNQIELHNRIKESKKQTNQI